MRVNAAGERSGKAVVKAPVTLVASRMRSLISAQAQKPVEHEAAPAARPFAWRPRPKPDHWTCARLWLRIQADAFLFDPPGYLQAVAWRIRGLRVRSRNRLAALAGRSPSAYEFWIACREPRLRAPAPQVTGGAPIVVVIDCRDGSDGLDCSLLSLPAGTRAVVIGGGDARGAASVGSIAGLAEYLEGSDHWICPIACGDRLASDALAVYAEEIAREPNVDLVYADDDMLDSSGRRRQPHFKPDWNEELFRHHDFLTGASLLRVGASDLSQVSGKDWPAELVRKVLKRGGTPLHVSRILHHRRRRHSPVVPGKPSPAPEAVLASVTAVIPTRNRTELLRKCIDGLMGTDYPRLGIIVVDNGSDEPECMRYLGELQNAGVTVIRIEGPFNYSALNNEAAAKAEGQLLCFLNNDVEVLETDWLSLMVRQAVRPDVGAVGARLLYPDGTVQHAGVFTGIGGGAGHGHRFVRENDSGYFERARLPQYVSAVTGACLVVSRAKFLAVGGFDEEDFPVAFNDVDLCLKLNERGWQSLYEPRATLIHHESKSRGSDSLKANRTRFARELAALKRKWQTDKRPDPFHHPNLSPFCEQFLIGV